MMGAFHAMVMISPMTDLYLNRAPFYDQIKDRSHCFLGSVFHMKPEDVKIHHGGTSLKEIKN